MAAFASPGKQHYLLLSRPDKCLCHTPRTNTVKVTSPDRYPFHNNLCQASLSWWHVIERPHICTDIAEYRPVNIFLEDYSGRTGLVLIAVFLCTSTNTLQLG
ncbi:hypothetical protein CHARACLAT_013667 [Characodon lateralis]|uniref:Uncharacterized protein n=1 Tax=Characodon lateralis TaxID=208331 RepID=A0ABU7CNG1_9TELE|nr:hypothetical protein [Characodon lateralis]